MTKGTSKVGMLTSDPGSANGYPTHSNAIRSNVVEEAVRRCAWTIAVLECVYLSSMVVNEPQLNRILNLIGPILLGASCLSCAFLIVRARPLSVWIPMPWFLLACSLYFGVGPLAYRFGDGLGAETELDLPLEWMMFRTNSLNAVGTLCILVGYLLLRSRLLSRSTCFVDQQDWKPNSSGAGVAFLIFICVGVPAKYLFSLPYEFGETDITVPGVVLSLAQLAPIALLLLGFLSRSGRVSWMAAFGILFCLELIVSVIQFSKTAVAGTLLCSVLGIYLGKPRLKVLMIAAPIVLLIYIAITPLVSEGRDRIARQNRDGLFYQASLGERLEIGRSFLTSYSQVQDKRKNTWWDRLCYAGPQAFAMQLYDVGAAGDSLLMAVYTVVPRFVWPNKPIITDVGVDFTELMFGHRGSSTGIGIYGEAYWNGGWFAVIGACLYIGTLLAILERVSDYVMSRSLWLLTPCVIMGIRIALRIDGWFASDYVGGPIICAVAFGGAIVFLLPFLSSTPHRCSRVKVIV